MKLDTKDKFVFTIFGASGDLAFLKIFPAIFELYSYNSLKNDFWVFGYARSDMDDISFRERFKQSIQQSYPGFNKNLLDELLGKIYYVKGDYGDENDFKMYQQKVQEITKSKYETEIFHFSTPPEVYEKLVECIEKNVLDKSTIRLVFEKPFGEDYESALKLSHYLGKYFDKNSVYLLDHYLGKEQVRSLLELRERNKFLSDMVQGKNVKKIIITALEDKEVENRLGYYDKVGATRDMIQSHLLQLLSLLLMKIPVKIDLDSININKNYILDSLTVDQAAFGQYKNYCQNKEYLCSPFTDTFVAAKLYLNIEEWYSVPIYIVTGKGLEQKETRVSIEFKNHDFQIQSGQQNALEFEIYPKSEIKFKLINSGEKSGELNLHQNITSELEDNINPHARLLMEVFKGDKKHFLTFEQVLASWIITEKILKQKKHVFKYEKMSNQSLNKELKNLEIQI